MDPSPTQRFSHLAENYAKHRPTYPEAAIDWLVSRIGAAPLSLFAPRKDAFRSAKSDSLLLADLGAGTGISTRLLAERGIPVIGIEPNEPMRTQAEKTPWPGPGPAPRYQNGTGEATGFPDVSCDGVLAAQAFHWFDAEKALAEAERILKPGGWLFLMWNERDENDPFTKAYGDVFKQFTETANIEGKRHKAGNVLLSSPHFRDAERVSFPYKQEMGEDGLLGRALSVSYGPQNKEEEARLLTELRVLFHGWERGGRVTLKYLTTITAGHKP